MISFLTAARFAAFGVTIYLEDVDHVSESGLHHVFPLSHCLTVLQVRSAHSTYHAQEGACAAWLALVSPHVRFFRSMHAKSGDPVWGGGHGVCTRVYDVSLFKVSALPSTSTSSMASGSVALSASYKIPTKRLEEIQCVPGVLSLFFWNFSSAAALIADSGTVLRHAKSSKGSLSTWLERVACDRVVVFCGSQGWTSIKRGTVLLPTMTRRTQRPTLYAGFPNCSMPPQGSLAKIRVFSKKVMRVMSPRSAHGSGRPDQPFWRCPSSLATLLRNSVVPIRSVRQSASLFAKQKGFAFDGLVSLYVLGRAVKQRPSAATLSSSPFGNSPASMLYRTSSDSTTWLCRPKICATSSGA